MKSNLILAAALLGLTLIAHSAERPPNVVFILADDLGWADTTLNGHTRFYRTPNLERLAARGMTFSNAYSASPLCSPTRAAILTGLSPARVGITAPECHVPQVVMKSASTPIGPPHKKSTVPVSASRLDIAHQTLAENLKQAGYATGHFGKWHLGPEPFSPLQHGFDIDIPHFNGPGPAGGFIAPWGYKDFEPDPNIPDQHIEDRMALEAVEWMEQNKDHPFFLNYWMFSVHAPFDAKADLIRKYEGKVDPKDAQRCPTYAAMVESMDDAVGTLLDALDRLGLAENTIIIFTSDNGGNMYDRVDGESPTSNRPLRGGKATIFEGGTRVPCVIAWPGKTKPGSRSDAIIQSEDFHPTLVKTLGIETDQPFDGIDIAPALAGRPLERDAVFQYFPHDPPVVPDWLPPSVAVRSGDWKLIRVFHYGENGGHLHHLYDLSEDIGETRDLAAKQPERVRALDAKIEAFLKDTGAALPLPNPKFNPAKFRPERIGVPKRKKPAGKPAAK
jgi:arylsulfatase A-like enzyme